MYYGLRIRGRLVAAAGTHIVSRDARLAVVGNVMTDAGLPRPRLREGGDRARSPPSSSGSATMSSSTSAPTTRPRFNAYRRIGYLEHVRFEERLVRGAPARSSAELAAALRRRLTPGDDLMTEDDA